MKKKKVLDQTDWEKVNSMSSEEIDCSDLPEVDESFFKTASFRANMGGEIIEPDIIDFFKKLGNDYKKRINDLLRAHIDATAKSRLRLKTR